MHTIKLKTQAFRPLAGILATALLALVAAPLTAAAANITFIKSVGTTTSTTAATTTAITVPAAGVAAGNSIVITFGLPSNALAGAVTATDTAGNVYTANADVTNAANARIVVLSAHKVTALASGNTITVTHPSTNRRNLVINEFAGLAASPVDQTASNTGSESSATPATSGTTGTTLVDHELLIGAFGVSGPSSDNFSAGAGYTAGGRVSASATAPTVTNIQEYQIVNAIGEYSAGFTTTTATVRPYAGAIVTFSEDVACGNGTIDAGEDCDEGDANNGSASSCCTASCRYRASGATCRTAAGVCDVAEVCSGAAATCPTDDLRPNGFSCRGAAGECDLPEVCTGSNVDCPADLFVAADTPCTDDGTSCTVDSCNGTVAACQHPADTGTPCVKFIQTVGSTTSTTAATTTAITVPAAGVSSGGSVIITVGLPSNALVGTVSAADTAGNVYAIDADVTNAANSRVVVLSSHKVEPLVSGNTITVTHPSTNRRNVVVAEYSGLAASPNVDQSTSNTGSENNVTPATSGTTALTTQKDDLLIGAFGVSGPSSDNFTAGSGYLSAGRVSASATAPTVTNIQEYRVVNNFGTYSAGFTTTTTTARPYAGAIIAYKADTNCGNGTIDAGEDCDLGFASNGLAATCCTRNCQFRSASGVCRAQNGVCDVAETCTGTTETCPVDSIRDTTFTCRAVAGECDPSAEVCDGINKTCPNDNLLVAGTPCTADTNPCTVDQCTGASATCNHASAGNAGAVCRAAAASCDSPEVCNGTSTTCPANAFFPAGTVCRLATDLCDVDDVCSGVSQSCGPDNVRANGFICRSSTDTCDAADTCNGVSKVCVDTVQGSGTPCRGATDLCDLADVCDGSSKVCADGVKSAGTVCGDPPSDLCDKVDSCDGTAKNCTDTVQPATEVCRPEAGVCDVAENCDGSLKACPADAFRPVSFTCREAAGLCDIPDKCPGTGANCTADVLQPAEFVCRPPTNECDVPDHCSGSEVDCTADDAIVADGTLCEGNDPNLCKNACVTGQCIDGAAVSTQACCGNGILDAGETCDDGNQASGDACPSLPADACKFSQGGTLVRGSKKKPAAETRACQVELSVANPNNPLDRYNLPSMQQTCTDGDPSCDLDPTVGRCRFAVATCLNNTDASIICIPNGVGFVDVKRQPHRPSPQFEMSVANAAKVETAVGQLLDPNNPGAYYTNSVPLSVGQQNFCSSTFTIDVLAGTAGADAKRKTFDLKLLSADSAGKRARTRVRFTCLQ